MSILIASLIDGYSVLPIKNNFPEVGLNKQSIWFAVVLLPLPVLPTKAILESGILILMFFNAYSCEDIYRIETNSIFLVGIINFFIFYFWIDLVEITLKLLVTSVQVPLDQ